MTIKRILSIAVTRDKSELIWSKNRSRLKHYFTIVCRRCVSHSSPKNLKNIYTFTAIFTSLICVCALFIDWGCALINTLILIRQYLPFNFHHLDVTGVQIISVYGTLDGVISFSSTSCLYSRPSWKNVCVRDLA